LSTCPFYQLTKLVSWGKELGYISCQFPSSGGSMGTVDVLQLVLVKKITKYIVNHSTTTQVREKISTDLGILRI